MSNNGGTPSSLDFLVDKKNLYREESFTDLKIANIRQLSPVHTDGSEDNSREVIFLGSTQLTSPQGPIPIQAQLEASTLEQAMDVFPKAMEAETKKMIAHVKQLQEKQKKENNSRIIMPGVN